MSRPDALKPGLPRRQNALDPGLHGVRTSLTPASLRQNALDPGLHGVRTLWIWGFMAFLLPRAHPDHDADGTGVS